MCGGGGCRLDGVRLVREDIKLAGAIHHQERRTSSSRLYLLEGLMVDVDEGLWGRGGIGSGVWFWVG